MVKTNFASPLSPHSPLAFNCHIDCDRHTPGQSSLFHSLHPVISSLARDYYYKTEVIERGPTDDSEITTISLMASIQFGAVHLHIQLSFLNSAEQLRARAPYHCAFNQPTQLRYDGKARVSPAYIVYLQYLGKNGVSPYFYRTVQTSHQLELAEH